MPSAWSMRQAFAISIQHKDGDVDSSTWVARSASAWMLGSLGSRNSLTSFIASQRLHRSFSLVETSSGVVEDTMLRMML